MYLILRNTCNEVFFVKKFLFVASYYLFLLNLIKNKTSYRACVVFEVEFLNSKHLAEK